MIRLGGMLGWSRPEILKSKSREIHVAWDAKELTEWDRCSILASLQHNLLETVGSLFSKSQPKPVSYHDYHPYRKKPAGQSLTVDALKAWGEAWERSGGTVIREKKKPKNAVLPDDNQRNRVQ